jgi:hypothetical protein
MWADKRLVTLIRKFSEYALPATFRFLCTSPAVQYHGSIDKCSCALTKRTPWVKERTPRISKERIGENSVAKDCKF